MRKSYPSDMSREQFEAIRSLLEGARKRTAPRKVDFYEVFCAVLYILKSGCQWRMLPEGFPRWQLVYYYWRLWSRSTEGSPSLLERALNRSSYPIDIVIGM